VKINATVAISAKTKKKKEINVHAKKHVQIMNR
jgi:hypothetical protein